jgi:hypothetical protein
MTILSTNKTKKLAVISFVALFIASSISLGAYAANNLGLSAAITGGLSVSLVGPTEVEGEYPDLTSPHIHAGEAAFDPGSSQTVDAIFDHDYGYISVANMTDVPEWALSIAATDGEGALWSTTSGAAKMDFNDADTGNDGADTPDAVGGSLTVDTSGVVEGSIISMSNGTVTGVTKGSTAAFTGATSITLMSGGATASAPAAWGISDIKFTQVIPQAQAAATYTIDLTLSVM